MKKVLTVLIAVLLLFSLSVTAFATNSGAYWHEKRAASTDPFYTNWMKNLSDGQRLSELSIPGTHDTMTFDGVTGNLTLVEDIAFTQSMTLQQQLTSGIRFIDIRPCYRGDHFSIHHGPVYLKADLEDVLRTVKTFLQKYPSEFIVMRLLQEYVDVSESKMNKLFRQYYERYKDIFYQGENVNDPSVGEMRGKVLLVADRWKLPKDIPSIYITKDQNSVKYFAGNDNFYVQDYSSLKTNWDLYDKWESVKNLLNKADKGNTGDFYLNYLNSSSGSFPFFVASGKITHSTWGKQLATGITFIASSSKYPDFPREKLIGSLYAINFMGTNQLTADYIKKNQCSRVGIIAADFPGEELIRAVIDCNFR